jgi:DNA-binding NarL/FixJ family response regulator
MSDEWEEGYTLVSTERISTVIEGKKPDDVLSEELRFKTTDKRKGSKYISRSRVQALAVGILIEDYNIDPQQHSNDCIPIEIATDGNPAIVAYLLGALGYSRGEVCDTLGISNQTISKYISRIRR